MALLYSGSLVAVDGQELGYWVQTDSPLLIVLILKWKLMGKTKKDEFEPKIKSKELLNGQQ